VAEVQILIIFQRQIGGRILSVFQDQIPCPLPPVVCQQILLDKRTQGIKQGGKRQTQVNQNM
jgi:hypothetical protein